MPAIPELARQAIEQARFGNHGEALALAKRALTEQPRDPGLTFFIGTLHARQMELDEAARYLHEAIRLSPADAVAKLELARVLLGLNRLDEADGLLTERHLEGGEARRLRALILMRRGNHREAATLFEANVRADPRDFESRGNLGVCRLNIGQATAAIEQIEASLRLRRDQQRFRDKWAEAQVVAGLGEDGLKRARDYAAENPGDVLVKVTIARLEMLLGRPGHARAALEAALALDPDHVPALTALARLHERENRLAEMAALVTKAEALPVPIPDLPLLRAQLAFRRGDLELARSLAEALPVDTEPGVRAQLLGQIHDRLGNAAQAFAAFTEMNRDNGVDLGLLEARATGFRQGLERLRQGLTRERVRGWSSATAVHHPPPIFIVGFPRSGTTLLDTLLMGHPRLCIAEEKPMLDTVEQAVGGQERLGDLSAARLEELRTLYYEEAERHVGRIGNRILVDKQPFAMIGAPLIYRLFPAARFVFAQRHPCDAVLSCFITRFEPNEALANFTTLDGTATIYDEAMRVWAQSRAVLPLTTHSVRYERLVEEPEAEMRALLNFLGLDWRDEALDNVATASRRGFVATPSYAQVAEPLYGRAVGRWQRYRAQMEPVLSKLRLWADVMGYEI